MVELGVDSLEGLKPLDRIADALEKTKKSLPSTPWDIVPTDNLKVILIGGEVKYYVVSAVDDIFYRDEHSALSAGSTESYAEVSDLDPPTGQIYWIGKIEVDGNVKVYLKQPASTNRWGTNKAPEGGLIFDISSPITDAEDVNIWIAEDYPPNVQLINGTNVSITPVLWWKGKRFAVKELTEEPKSYYTAKIGGIGE